ncbi:unnamed protein product, partial [Didymodactylos carnosus]
MQKLRFHKVKIKHILHFISSLLVPLMIGVFTIVLAVVEIQKAASHRTQDLRIAENREKENILENYFKDVSQLILKNTTFMKGSTASIVIRAKTLTAVRQLDGKRNAYLIQFLYESRLISDWKNSINLVGAELNNLHLGSDSFKRNLMGIQLSGISLINASFINAFLSKSNFGSGCNLRNANFRYSRLRSSNFYNASLQRADFTGADLYGANFAHANLSEANISQEQLDRASSLYLATLPNNRKISEANLILNGNAEQGDDCTNDTKTLKSTSKWNVTEGNIIRISYSAIGGILTDSDGAKFNGDKCYFWASNSVNASMYQTIDIRYSKYDYW